MVAWGAFMFSIRISCLLLAVSGRYRVGFGGAHDADLASGISGRTRVVARDQRLRVGSVLYVLRAERQLIEQRRDPSLKLGLAS